MTNLVIGLYIVFWMILSEKFNLERFIVGSIVCVVVAILNKKMINESKDNRRFTVFNVIYAVKYILVLIKEMFKSNLQVAKIVLSPNMKISPQIIKITTNLKSDFNKTILANSITLTPGTLTLEINKEELIVHCLEKQNVKVLKNSDFEKILLKAEGDAK